ncbi:MAG: cell envelope integrity EipB family protein, partial [Methyloceanibacter sp.]|nr:cell envelope integrity EipB family protein [Methyloceanibacter sp.]
MVRFGERLALVLLAAPLIGLTLTGHAQALAAKEPNKLVAHRAIYEMTLDDARSASGITGIDGRMVFEFTGSECDGYSLNMRMVTQMTDSQGQTNLTDLRSSTWEQGDGQKFRFQSAQYLNDKLGDVTMGRAVRETPSEAVKVKLSQPAQAELNLSGQVLFPTQHSLALIEAARAGQVLFQARIYDGSEKGRKVYDTTAFIGTMVPPGNDPKL